MTRISCILILFLISCESVPLKEVYSFSEYTEKYIEENEETYVVEDASSSFELHTLNGCTFIFNENTFLKNGFTFYGELRLKFLFVHDRITMIKSGMPSLFKDPDGDIFLLESGGELLLQAYDNSDGTELSASRVYTAEIPRSLTGAQSYDMGVFIMEDQDSKIWTKINSSSTGNSSNVFNSEDGFQLFLQRFGWINCDDIIDVSGEQYEFSIKHPSGYDESNSHVFLTLNGFPNSIGNLTLKVLENEKGNIIFIARDEDTYYMTSESFVATSDTKFDFSNITLTKVFHEDINAYLSSVLE